MEGLVELRWQQILLVHRQACLGLSVKLCRPIENITLV